MNFLRSSPFNPLVLASALHAFILFCCVDEAAGVAGVAGVAAAGAPAIASCFSTYSLDRHFFMNALRSSPFMPVASLLQPFIFSPAAKAGADTVKAKPKQASAIIFFMGISLELVAVNRRGKTQSRSAPYP